MTEILYTDRIIQLIELNHNDSEILKIIHEEYNIYLSIDAVQKKRNSISVIDLNPSYNQNSEKTTNLILEEKTDLIREMFEDIYYVPLTKKEIIKKIYENHKIIITQIDAKEILWKILKSELIYDRNDWTYKLKNIESSRLNFNNVEFESKKETNKKIEVNIILKIISEEKYRIGKSDANLLAENIIFRLNNNLWD